MIHVSEPCLGASERRQLLKCLAGNQITMGPMVERFEREFAERLSVKHAIACSSGTTALHLALAARGIGPGDEVLVPALTFVATVNAVAYVGATPVLVDVDMHDWNISLGHAQHLVTKRTRAILPVHLYGMPCDPYRLREFVAKNDLLLVEDAAEGLGGSVGGRPLGTFGDAGVFSFYGNKVLTTGEGGMVVTNDDEYAGFLRHLRGQGQSRRQRYFHDMVGFNYRLTDLQAAIGVGQLSHLDTMLARRRRIVDRYTERLQSHGALARTGVKDAVQAPWLFTIMVGDRDRIADGLADRGIETRPSFVPMHQLPMYREANEHFPAASALGASGLSLPTHPGLALDEVDWICDAFIQECGKWKSTTRSSCSTASASR